ncbi:PIN domain-containing protein [Candidimonas humi]|jgi:toxin-antitoxin system PIN domain toxin|uniref:Ribonuclease VapC n=1 Tax=Candidimonas humi TaxID=683355 RepID=A0ABV8NXR1_9BURK|nr:TA system VapC family ribonuclease toxin [Candidimonas humi]MBV6307385.1 PIN domain-containing protein [Candidimonas humi]
MTPDVNVLVAASRSDHPHHAPARLWLERAVSDAGQGMPLSLQPMVIASFLRLVTHPKIFMHPTPMAEALHFIDALLTCPGVERAELGGEWVRLRQLCMEKDLSANQVPDAWLAAAALHQGEHVVSFDADFRRLLPKSQFTRLAA